MFLSDRPKPTKLENHLFQIKEVESGATSTIVQPTPNLGDSMNMHQRISSGQRKGEKEQDAIEEVKTEDVEDEANT